MAQVINTSIEIDSTPDQVWSVLTDFKNYRDWNPFVKNIEGEFLQGRTLSVCLELPDGKAMVFNPVLIKIEPTKRFIWSGKVLFSGLFDGEHCFEIEQLDKNKTVFHHSERFSGLLSKLIFKIIGQSTVAGFHAMNAALKQRVEGVI